MRGRRRPAAANKKVAAQPLEQKARGALTRRDNSGVCVYRACSVRVACDQRASSRALRAACSDAPVALAVSSSRYLDASESSVSHLQ